MDLCTGELLFRSKWKEMKESGGIIEGMNDFLTTFLLSKQDNQHYTRDLTYLTSCQAQHQIEHDLKLQTLQLQIQKIRESQVFLHFKDHGIRDFSDRYRTLIRNVHQKFMILIFRDYAILQRLQRSLQHRRHLEQQYVIIF